MDRIAKLELFEQLRREHEFGVGTITGVASKFGVHRRMVRQAIASAVPAAHHYPQRSRPKLGTVTAFIDGILEKDRGAPRKQRHTARRILVTPSDRKRLRQLSLDADMSLQKLGHEAWNLLLASRGLAPLEAVSANVPSGRRRRDP